MTQSPTAGRSGECDVQARGQPSERELDQAASGTTEARAGGRQTASAVYQTVLVERDGFGGPVSEQQSRTGQTDEQ